MVTWDTSPFVKRTKLRSLLSFFYKSILPQEGACSWLPSHSILSLNSSPGSCPYHVTTAHSHFQVAFPFFPLISLMFPSRTLHFLNSFNFSLLRDILDNGAFVVKFAPHRRLGKGSCTGASMIFISTIAHKTLRCNTIKLYENHDHGATQERAVKC